MDDDLFEIVILFELGGREAVSLEKISLRSGHLSGLDRSKRATNSFPRIARKHRLLFGISMLDHHWGWFRGAMYRFYDFLVPKSTLTVYRATTDEIPY